jgi:hypothetical protein
MKITKEVQHFKYLSNKPSLKTLSCTHFPKIYEPPQKNLGARSKFLVEDPHRSGATVQNIVATAP